jgi:predicted ATPase/class 3 adenylate cyclase/Tfp pilus assembly protein PilF
MPGLPGGTVTFLFTDIEGSTRLWEEHPDAMRRGLARHDVLVRAAIERHEGVVFKTIGDAFCAAFHTAPRALAAALAAQQALLAEPWPEPISIAVRMALHTGAAEAENNDYFGPPLNRVARLLSVGHGGQVLLSQPTYALIGDLLPPSCALKDMGEHRLRDLNRPERLFQLLHPDLRADFPALKSLDSPDLPNNLPQQLTSFIGRERELKEIRSLLSRTRLLTLTGSGGCGKTRLAIQLGAEALDQYPDGVWLVELASLNEADLAPQTVASALNLAEQSGKTIVQTLTEHLKTRRLLLILDNCEHLLSACALLITALLRACPQVTVLATSREALGIGGEQSYRVPSLTLPDPGQVPSQERLAQYESARLFIERAQLVRTGFAVTSANAAALASVCYRLDGIPLALELAAARVKSLTVEEINLRLDQRFRLLTGGDRTALPRQQTLRAAIDWSYDLLTERERQLLARLSAFAGGWTLEAAEAICGDDETALDDSLLPGSPNHFGVADCLLPAFEVLDLLTGLVDKSLVTAQTQAQSARYTLQETMRQYARDRLAESAETMASLRSRFRNYFLELAEEIMPKLRGSEQVRWYAVLEAEHDNLRQALQFCAEDPGAGEAGLRLAGALWRFWWTQGHLSEGRERLGLALSHVAGQARTGARAAALNGAGVVAFQQGDYAAARALFEEGLAIQRELRDLRGIAGSLTSLGNVTHAQGDYAAARSLIEESLAIVRQLGDRPGLANALINLGNVAYEQGDYAAAWSMFEESLKLLRQLGDKHSIAMSLNNLGSVAHVQGDLKAARSYYEESLALRRELGDRHGVAMCLGNLGELVCEQDDYALARSLFEESLAIRHELGDRPGIAHCLGFLGNVARRQEDFAAARSLHLRSLKIRQELGDKTGICGSMEALASLDAEQNNRERAASLWGAAFALRQAIGAPLPPHEHEKQERETAEVRASLGESAFAASWEAGRTLSPDQALALLTLCSG